MDEQKDAVDSVHDRGRLQHGRTRPEQRHGLRQAQGLGAAGPLRAQGRTRSSAGPWAPSGRAAMPGSSRSPRRRSSSWAMPPASTSSCRTAPASATPSSWRPATSCSAWPPRTPMSRPCAPTGWTTSPSTTSGSTGTGPAPWASPSRPSTIRSSSAWGGSYVNDFINQSRVKRVFMQADAPFRMQLEDLNSSMSATPPATWFLSPPSPPGNGATAPPTCSATTASPPSTSSGSRAPARAPATPCRPWRTWPQKLPQGIGYEWTGLSFQERQAGAQAPALYAFSVLVIFLCLAALYESWSIPFSVLLVLPLGVFGAVLATWGRGSVQRRLLPDRPADHAGPHRQERHPDRAVRRGADGPGRGPHRSGHGGLPPAAAPDPDDLPGLHLRRAAPGPHHRAPAPRPRTPSAPAWSAAC